ncbi:sulfatase-like hydrolase/transferase [Candidatus Parabeggiatoa sp. HSG14]|uniref:sulfatase-like hydrolase/transferase n=1 Tax=Candidatus Parabeggiatoa sp. HSG14 TaxID=3055593 RepID=UPI0025A6C46D|nr:sulfatase-like hydrolase/transferase [Thiotrichales bacterium HSG14]
MKRKFKYMLISLSCMGVAYLVSGNNIASAYEQPNIVLLMTDDQGWKQTGYYGSSTVLTPNLDMMAANGLQFNRFYATAPVCSPTRSSILTGRHHNRPGCLNVKNCVLDTRETTLAEAVKPANYVTGHFGKWHIGKLIGSNSSSPGDNGFEQWVSAELFFDLDATNFVRNGEKEPQVEGDGSDFIVKEAISFIEEAVNNDKKFMAVIWYAAPHSPWNALDSDKALFSHLTEDEQNFYGELYAMDRSIGTLRAKLKTLGIEQNTLLWFMSDNGPTKKSPDPKASGALKGSKGKLWEAGIRVPAVIEWPEMMTSATKTNVPVSTLDIYPTILDILNITVENQLELDGSSILPLLKGTITERADAIPFWFDSDIDTLTSIDIGHAVWMTDQYKLHKIADTSAIVEYQLYDMKNDAVEKTDLSLTHTSVLEPMKVLLENWQQTVLTDFSATETSAESDTLFNWAEQNFPTYFSPPNALTQSIADYLARYYSETNTWLGTKNGIVYVYGTLFNDIPPVGLSIKTVGAVTDYIPTTHATYIVVDTGQSVLYDNTTTLTNVQQGEPYFGQDANYLTTPFSYTDNNNGTINDNNTGLLWEQAHHAERLSYFSAKTACESLEMGDYSDWRLPTLKELFSLADFRGSQWKERHFYLDGNVFDFDYPDSVDDNDQFSTHTVQMMGQTWSSTIYTGDHMNNPNQEAAFFFNFLDGHIKQAPTSRNTLFYRCVRGDEYGENEFANNDDGTVTDKASGLMWQQADDSTARNWQDSLAYCEGLKLSGHNDWRLPDIKELQSIVDYTRHNPAIDPEVFTQTDPEGWFWSSTTHGDNITTAAYICFGKCDSKDGVDTHGAGAQRSDPKVGDPANYANFGGAQDDDVRINNYARCVRGSNVSLNYDSSDIDSAGSLPGGTSKETPNSVPKRLMPVLP